LYEVLDAIDEGALIIAGARLLHCDVVGKLRSTMIPRLLTESTEKRYLLENGRKDRLRLFIKDVRKEEKGCGHLRAGCKGPCGRPQASTF